jgi:hypothetical protein
MHVLPQSSGSKLVGCVNAKVSTYMTLDARAPPCNEGDCWLLSAV